VGGGGHHPHIVDGGRWWAPVVGCGRWQWRWSKTGGGGRRWSRVVVVDDGQWWWWLEKELVT